MVWKYHLLSLIDWLHEVLDLDRYGNEGEYKYHKNKQFLKSQIFHKFLLQSDDKHKKFVL